jgi:hypothetical protein
MILCIGSIGDNTFRYTINVLRELGMHIEVLDIAEFIVSGGFIHFTETGDTLIEFANKKRHSIKDYASIYVRLVDITAGAPTEEFQKLSRGIFLSGLTFLSEKTLRVLNPPSAQMANFSKIVHAQLGNAITNWRIPKSCLTNSPSSAADFIVECQGNVIYKGCSAQKTWVSTYDSKLHEHRLPLLKKCPVLFQERIIGPDVRIHVVDKTITAEMITSDSVDYRRIKGNRYQQIVSPDYIQNGCLQLVRDSQCPLLGIDFKICNASGEWYFLEANTMPCYEGYDKRSGGKISNAIASWLSTSTT